MHCYTQCPQPCSRPLLTHGSARDSWKLTGKSLLGSMLLSSGSWCIQGSVCTLPESVSPVLCKFWKGRGTRDQIANSSWIIKKASEFQKNIYFCFIDYAKAFDCVDDNKLWKIPKEMKIPNHLTCHLKNLYVGQGATVTTGHGTTDWFQIGKGVWQGCMFSPCLFNLYAEYIMRNADWMKHKLESRFLGEMSITSDMQMTPPLWQKAKRN